MPDAENIPGIPDRSDYGDLSRLTTPQLVDYFLQRHQTVRNPKRPHYDLRLGTPETDLYSWAVPGAKLPGPGERTLAPMTSLHAHSYGAFHGPIHSRYGQGWVDLADKGKAYVTAATPNKVNFTVAHKKIPTRYSLIRIGTGKDKRDWLLIGRPVGKQDVPGVGEKPVIKVVKDKDLPNAMAEAHHIQAKLDGASTVIDIDEQGRPEAYSVRKSVTGDPIVHTERLGLSNLKIPSLKGTTFRGEAYGMSGETGKAIPFQQTSGLLNASIAKSIADQKAKNIQMRVAPFEMLRFKGQPVDKAQQDELLKTLSKKLPSSFKLPAEAKTPDAKQQLLSDIRAGKVPTTDEGIVLYGDKGPTGKYVIRPDATVYFKGLFPGEGKRKNTAGGILASLKPDADATLRIGTGFSDEELADMIANQKDYMKRPVRIEHKGQFGSGLFRAPSFRGFETDKSAGLFEVLQQYGNSVQLPSRPIPINGASTNAVAQLRNSWANDHSVLSKIPGLSNRVNGVVDGTAQLYSHMLPRDRAVSDRLAAGAFNSHLGQTVELQPHLQHIADQLIQNRVITPTGYEKATDEDWGGAVKDYQKFHTQPLKQNTQPLKKSGMAEKMVNGFLKVADFASDYNPAGTVNAAETLPEIADGAATITHQAS